MALSGSYYVNVRSHWRLQLEWSATQNTSGNYSDVTARLYWIDRGTSTGIRSTATKNVHINIGSSGSSSTATAGLSRNQKKLIHTHTRRINHNANGTASVGFNAYFDANVTLSGSWVGRVSLPTRTFTLDTIGGGSAPTPNVSEMTSHPNWTAGLNRTVTLKRNTTTNVWHGVDIAVKNYNGHWIDIRTLSFQSGVLSLNTGFSTSQNRTIFLAMGQREEMECRWTVRTISSSGEVGREVYTGVVVNADASTLVSTFDHYVFVDETIFGGISRNNASFNHKVEIKLGSYTKTITGVTTSFEWTPSLYERNQLYNQMPNVDRLDGTITLTTYFDDVQVKPPVTDLLQFQVNELLNRPIFNSNNIQHRDISTSIVSITGDNQYIVQGRSMLNVIIPTGDRAVGQNGASIVEYIATVGDAQITRPHPTSGQVTFSFGTINSNVNQTLTIMAVDSRGFGTSVTKTIPMIPYSSPGIIANAERSNGFDASTELVTGGIYSPVRINNSNKNAITRVRYRYRYSNSSTYIRNWTTLSYSVGSNTFVSTPVNINLDSSRSFIVEFEVVDAFGIYTTYRTVSEGRPIMFVDSDKKSVGVGMFPTYSNSLEVDGDIRSGGSRLVNESRSISAGAGLTGGGTLAYNRTLSVDSTVARRSAVNTFTSTNTFNSSTYFDGSIIRFSSEPTSSVSETGYCGAGGMTHTSRSANQAIAGNGVNFRIKKTYTPSSITFSQLGSTTYTSVFGIQISQEGFWCYIGQSNGVSSGGSASFFFWRGHYTA